MSKGQHPSPASLSSIPILFFNVHCSIQTVKILLNDPIFKDILILCIQELPFNTICNIPSMENSEGVPYKGIPYNPNWHLFISNEKHPRMVTFIHNSCISLLPVSYPDIISSPDFQLISLSFPKKHYFLNCYLDPSDDSSISYLKSYIHLFPNNIVCTGGDFNTHSPE